MKHKKIYCGDCKYYGYGLSHCCHPTNIKYRKSKEDFSSPEHKVFDKYILEPAKKNKNNDCKDFEAEE